MSHVKTESLTGLLIMLKYRNKRIDEKRRGPINWIQVTPKRLKG